MKPTLFVLAAGMGSRYGGLKQLDGLGPHGETIMDHSIYDAIHSGFGKVVFVIRKDFEADFREKILSKYEGHIPVELVFQGLNDLPEGFNADDYYGRNSFEVMAQELSSLPEDSKGHYSMVGFKVGNTMSESGTVARGVCETSDGLLTGVVERTSIGFDADHNIVFTDENGDVQHLDFDTPVSMNFWGFTPDYFVHSERCFIDFLKENIDKPKAEFFIPTVVNEMVTAGTAQVKVLKTESKWFGVTYAADRQTPCRRRLSRQDVLKRT